MVHLSPSTLALLMALCGLPGVCGCAGYRWGHRTLYRPDVRTVHVPIFESDSFRRDLGEQLTEAVVREIQLKTPYTVVTADRADSVLRGRIINETKRLVAESREDTPRIVEANLIAQIDWRGRQGNLLSNSLLIPIDDYTLRVGQAQQDIPEAGQSVAVTQQKAIQQLAEQIVAQMEMPPW